MMGSVPSIPSMPKHSLKILLVNTGILSVPPQKAGAVELHSYNLANQLALLGNEVHFVTSVNSGASLSPGVILHKLPDMSFSFREGYSEALINYAAGGVLAFLKGLEAMKENRYDVIHGHGNVSMGLLLQSAKKFKLVFTVHNPTPWMLTSSSRIKQAFRIISFRTFDLRIIRNADRVITVSEYLKKEIVNLFGIGVNRIQVIPNGVDTTLFKPFVPDSKSIRRKYGINNEYALFVGRLVEQKGVHSLIETMAGTRLHAVIVGGGPLLSYLQSLSRRLGVDKQIHFAGAVPSEELPKFYAEASVFVMPSLAEGLPIAGLEAMASGLPLLGWMIPGVDEIIKNEHNGFLLRLGDVKRLRQRLVQLFEDASLRKTMGVCSREIAQRCYSWEQVSKRTLQLYQTLV